MDSVNDTKTTKIEDACCSETSTQMEDSKISPSQMDDSKISPLQMDDSKISQSPPSPNSTFKEQWNGFTEANDSPVWHSFSDTLWNSSYDHTGADVNDNIDPALLDGSASPASGNETMTDFCDDSPGPSHNQWQGHRPGTEDRNMPQNALLANAQALCGIDLGPGPWQHLMSHRRSVSEPPESGACYVYNKPSHANAAGSIIFHRGGQYLGVPTQIARLKTMQKSQSRYSPYRVARSTPTEKQRKPRKQKSSNSETSDTRSPGASIQTAASSAERTPLSTKDTSQRATLTRSGKHVDNSVTLDGRGPMGTSPADRLQLSESLSFGTEQLKAIVEEAVNRAFQGIRADLTAQMESCDPAAKSGIQEDGGLPEPSEV